MTSNTQSFRSVTEFGAFKEPLRNIQMFLDGRSAAFYLIPEAISHEPPDLSEIDNPDLRSVLADTEEIIESATCLRLEFDWIYAVAIDSDVGGDLFGGVQSNWQEAPLLTPKGSYYPCLEILNSEWARKIPEWQVHPVWEVRHFRFISTECSFDILGPGPSGTWIYNPNLPKE